MHGDMDDINETQGSASSTNRSEERHSAAQRQFPNLEAIEACSEEEAREQRREELEISQNSGQDTFHTDRDANTMYHFGGTFNNDRGGGRRREGEEESVDNFPSDTRSITSSVFAGEYENGRRYHYFRHGRYPLPNDDDEQIREDMKHAMMLEVTKGKLFLAPLDESPKDILDLGTGTGIWCIDMGDKFPDSNIIGLDLSPIQPEWVPPNVKFLVDDMEDDWLFTSNFDLIHLRTIISVIKNPEKVLASSYRQMKPGGWIELQEVQPKTYCDDGTMTRDYPPKIFYELVHDAFLSSFGINTEITTELSSMLKAAGFINVQEQIVKLPIGTWPRDKTLRLVGLYWRMAIMDILPAMGGKPFLSIDMSAVEIEVFLASVRKALLDNKVHAYMNLHFVYGQKPPGDGDDVGGGDGVGDRKASGVVNQQVPEG